MNKQRMNPKILYLTQLASLLAILILMAFTPIGYLKTAGLEITFITVPVVLGAILLDYKASTFLGFAFGITSFIQAVSGMSAFGLMLFNIQPVYMFITCVVTRTLMGLLVGLFCAAWKKKTPLTFTLAGLLGPLLNTLFFMGCLLAFFWKTDFVQGIASGLGATNMLAFTTGFVGINGIVEAVVCTILSAALGTALFKALKNFH